MRYHSKALNIMQGIYDIAEILAQNQLFDVVLSPGSRCAPITNGIVHHPKLNCYSIIDERSASFYALGMSLATGKSSTLVCTSGSAGLNYSPAVAEAFFQEVPLLILTADRPPELIDQYDGQTIFQKEVFGNHVKKSFETPVSLNKDEISSTIKEAIKTANSKPYGPVHVNIPLKEPLYFEEEITFSNEDFKIGLNTIESLKIESALKALISNAENPMLVLGQGKKNKKLEKALKEAENTLIIKDVHSNSSIGLTEDDFFNCTSLPEPDLVISLNKSLISKNLKLYLKGLKNLKHIHIGTDRISPNTFDCLIGKINGEPEVILPQLDFQKSQIKEVWTKENKSIINLKKRFFENSDNTELDFYQKILTLIPNNSILHFANSMSIRYGNFFQSSIDRSAEIHCNRGTSGIDGSTSTAAGFSLKNKAPNILLTGDLSFFYDRNAFWNPAFPKNLKIIIFNNNGGGIFNMIPGPSLHKKSKDFFTTPRNHSAKHLAEEFSIKYLQCDDILELDKTLSKFIKSDNTTILEITSNQEENTERLKKLKQFIANNEA